MPVNKYLETFDALRRQKRWSTNTTILRFVAQSLAASGLDDPHSALEKATRELRQRAGWLSPLRSEVRYIVAALILRRGLDPGRVHGAVVRTRERMRKKKLPRGRTHELFAALLLVLHENGGAVPQRNLDRLAGLYRRFKNDHFWLTGADDLPSAAILATHEESVDSIALDVETIYRSLRGARFSRGNQLQLVSQLLAIDSRSASAMAERFRRVAEALKAAGEKIRSGRYDEVAILSLTTTPPAALVSKTIRARDRLREARPRPSKNVAFSLATGLMLALEEEKANRKAGDLSSMLAVKAMLDAQQAAVAAAAAGAAAAT